MENLSKASNGAIPIDWNKSNANVNFLRNEAAILLKKLGMPSEINTISEIKLLIKNHFDDIEQKREVDPAQDVLDTEMFRILDGKCFYSKKMKMQIKRQLKDILNVLEIAMENREIHENMIGVVERLNKLEKSTFPKVHLVNCYLDQMLNRISDDEAMQNQQASSNKDFQDDERCENAIDHNASAESKTIDKERTEVNNEQNGKICNSLSTQPYQIARILHTCPLFAEKIKEAKNPLEGKGITTQSLPRTVWYTRSELEHHPKGTQNSKNDGVFNFHLDNFNGFWNKVQTEEDSDAA